MSSHREAPEISKDPVADSTDLYAFVSPDAPDTVTIIANYVPLQGPAGGPNFYEFGDDVVYEINIDNDADGDVDITYEFQFTTVIEIGGTFLYNVGPITSLTSSNWNRRQFYSVTRIDWEDHKKHCDHGHRHHHGHERRPGVMQLASNLPCPPCNVGPRSTPDYGTLANAAIQTLTDGTKVFAGQRAEGFYVDLGSIFDLGALRPIQGAHLIPIPGSAAAVNATKDLNVHAIALQIPKTLLTHHGDMPTDTKNPLSVIGVYTSASRQRVHFNHGRDDRLNPANFGPWSQVSRLGNPLFNEVLVPMERKDDWNQDPPSNDSEYADGVLHPELAKLLPVLYPGAFPNLAALVNSGKPRADLAAVLLTGIPLGVVSPDFQNFTGTTQADLLRLNMAVPPTPSPNNLGAVGGDLGGYPNGRRLADDVVTIELKAIAGATYPLVDSTFTPDAAVGIVDQGLTSSVTDQTAKGTESYLPNFPYLGTPHSGYEVPAA
ncbi:MAG: hypothetical protein QOI44_762 [Actinomycetota bacterium]|jgi:hypothetical protein|nr:hypothetical protein [Actinomycetota bacterium]